MKIKFVILGVGRIGKVHVKAIKNNPLGYVFCIYDPDINKKLNL